MRSVIRQFKRIYEDDGRNDKTFIIQELRLKLSLENLKTATEEVIRAAQSLRDVLASRKIVKLR